MKNGRAHNNIQHPLCAETGWLKPVKLLYDKGKVQEVAAGMVFNTNSDSKIAPRGYPGIKEHPQAGTRTQAYM